MNAIIGLSGLKTGQEVYIPGEEIKNAAQKLWQQDCSQMSGFPSTV